MKGGTISVVISQHLVLKLIRISVLVITMTDVLVMVMVIVMVTVMIKMIAIVILVMTMMAIIAIIVAVIIVTSGSRVVHGRGSLVGTRALPSLLHYRVIQSVLGFLRNVFHRLILAIYCEMTITAAVITRDLCLWYYRCCIRYYRRR